MTQPAVTQHIQYLEDKYGRKLVTYENRTFSLTPAGEELRDRWHVLRPMPNISSAEWMTGEAIGMMSTGDPLHWRIFDAK